MGERQNRTLEVVGSSPICSTTIAVVLDGELAVPCNPQSAIAGFNSRPEVLTIRAALGVSGVEDRVPRSGSSLNPVRTGR